MAEPTSHGVLRTPPAGSWRLRRFDPPPQLAGLIGCAWASEWSLPRGADHLQAVLPHPVANVALEAGQLRFYGPVSERFDRTLVGTGRAIGVRFRPGVVRVLTGARAGTLVDRVVSADVLGLGPDVVAMRLAALSAADAAAELLVTVGQLIGTELDPVAAELRDVVELVERDDSVRTVDELAARTNRSRRTLQRLFAEHVGLSPAWVIRRYRLRRTVDHAEFCEGERVDWAAVAQRVGYYDQAHLVRDFTATVGTSPARYARGG